MPTTENIVAAYLIAGLITVAALFIWARKKGVRTPAWLSLIVLPEVLLLLLLVAVAVWPPYLIGVLICWFDTTSTGETNDRHKDKNA